jgi:hypothetical protein
MSDQAPHIFVATPCFGGLVTQRYMQCVFTLLQRGSERGYAVSLQMLGYESLITRGRNTLVSMFLDNPTATHLMFIDADIGFDPAEVEHMIDLGEDVVAGMYPLKILDWDEQAIRRVGRGEHFETAALRYVGVPLEEDAREERNGFVTGEFAGTGFMLIRREAIERMVEAYPETRYTAAHNFTNAPKGMNYHALFECMIEPGTGHYLSEDYAFCRRWRAIGGKVWLNTRSTLIHVGPHEFLGNPARRYAQDAAECRDLLPAA